MKKSDFWGIVLATGYVILWGTQLWDAIQIPKANVESVVIGNGLAIFLIAMIAPGLYVLYKIYQKAE